MVKMKITLLFLGKLLLLGFFGFLVIRLWSIAAADTNILSPLGVVLLVMVASAGRDVLRIDRCVAEINLERSI